MQALLTQAAATPIPSAKQGETRKATAGIVLTAVQAAMYDTDTWAQLAQALAAAQKGDAQGLFSLADSYNGRLANGTYTNLVDANLAINCADTDARYTQEQVRATIADWNTRYPLFGASTRAGPLHLHGVEGGPHAAAEAGRGRAARRSSWSATPATR